MTSPQLDSDVLSCLVDRYTDFVPLGRGKRAVVYKARDRLLDKDVAIKTLLSSDMPPEVVLQFQSEARIASKLKHTNLITLLDFGLAKNNTPYLIMDYVAGVTLEKFLAERGALTRDETIIIVKAICSALSYVHSHDIVHRDLKPSNVIIAGLVRGQITPSVRVKVVDFGIAKIRSTADESEIDVIKYVDENGVERQTTTQQLLGSPYYMSPEQIKGVSADARTDIYALGCMFYQMLCGRVPFAGSTHVETYQMHLSQEPPAMGVYVPPSIHELIFQCLAKYPEDRPESMAIVVEQIERVAELRQATATSSKKTERSIRKSVIYAVIVSAAAILFMGPVLVLLRTPEPEMHSVSQSKKRTDSKSEKPHAAAAIPFFSASWRRMRDANGRIVWYGAQGALDKRSIEQIAPYNPQFVVIANSMSSDIITGLSYMKDFPLLELELTNETIVDDSVAPAIARFTKLKALDIGGTGITNIGLKRLMPLRNLERLSLEALPGLNDESIKIIQYQWPDLRHLCLNATALSQTGLLQIYGFRKLRVLELGSNKLGDSVMSMVTTLPLVQLNLCHCHYSPKWLRSLSKMKTLKYLMLTRLKGVPDAEYEGLQKRFDHDCQVQLIDASQTGTNVSPLVDMMGRSD